ncbi:hypothetical protein D3C81_1795220 [compost metagenome]
MSRDRYGVDSDRQVSQPAGNEGPLQKPVDHNESIRQAGRDDNFDSPPFRRGQKQGPPDPSRVSHAERYSYHKRPLE